jgi:hypothetical protein
VHVRVEIALRLSRSLVSLRPETGRRDGESHAGKLDLNVVESELLRVPYDLRWLKPQSARDPVFASWEELKTAVEEFGREADADLAAHLRDELWDVVSLYQQKKKAQDDGEQTSVHAISLARIS